MKRNIMRLGIIALMYAAAFMGCENDPVSDSVKILSVTPGTFIDDGVTQQCTVTVEYYILHADRSRLYVAFNTHDFGIYSVYDSIDVTEKGSGNHTFNVAVTPKDWSPQGEFQVNVILEELKQTNHFVNGILAGTTWATTDTFLAYDRKTIPFTNDYWSITWELNGGETSPVTGWSVYPKQVARGAVLAQPSPNPQKPLPTGGYYFFGGWYTDSALTQEYNFTNSVTADLNLFAKWDEEFSIEHLYGTWSGRIVFPISEDWTLTISANSVRLVDNTRTNDYIQYSNVVWAQQPTANNNPTNLDPYLRTNYPRGYTFTGQRSYNGSSYADTHLGFAAISVYNDHKTMYVAQNAATPITPSNIPTIFVKQQ